MKKLVLLYILFTLIPVTIFADSRPTQAIHTEVYRLERQDSVLAVDLAVDLSQVRLTPDCTVYLFPLLFSGGGRDSLRLPPVQLNGPQSDLMYRRRKALGTTTGLENIQPYLILREGVHALPRIHYRVQVPYKQWMMSFRLNMEAVSCDCDDRLKPFSFLIETVPGRVVERIDTIIVRDTIRIAGRPLVAEAVPIKKVPEKGVEFSRESQDRTGVYFPVAGMAINPKLGMNKEKWEEFVTELDSLCADKSNLLIGVTVTGYSSPEGSYASNDQIAKQRALALKRFIEERYGNKMLDIRTEWVGEDWDGVVSLLKESAMPYKEEVLNVISRVGIFQGREMQVRLIDGSRPWQWMLTNIFPQLRRTTCKVTYVKRLEDEER